MPDHVFPDSHHVRVVHDGGERVRGPCSHSKDPAGEDCGPHDFLDVPFSEHYDSDCDRLQRYGDQLQIAGPNSGITATTRAS